MGERKPGTGKEGGKERNEGKEGKGRNEGEKEGNLKFAMSKGRFENGDDWKEKKRGRKVEESGEKEEGARGEEEEKENEEAESEEVEEGQESKRKMEELRVIDSREKFLYDRNGQTEADSNEGKERNEGEKEGNL